jgi:hypothetical protein
VTNTAQAPAYSVIAVDPVNLEKPSTHDLEGVSLVMKSTPPSLDGEKRLTRGYPAITVTIVNLLQPATTYANWFSYEAVDFISQNWEIYRALRISRALFSSQKLCFVGDAGLDDQKIFAQVARVNAEFVIRACHERNVHVYNPRLARWEEATLFDLVATVPFAFEQDVVFTHARQPRIAHIGFGWFRIRLPETQQILWVLVAHDFVEEHDLILLTNVPLENAESMQIGGNAGMWNTAIASIKKKDWMSKICGSRRWNAGGACSSWFCSPRNLCTTSAARGQKRRCSGYANWEANWD